MQQSTHRLIFILLLLLFSRGARAIRQLTAEQEKESNVKGQFQVVDSINHVEIDPWNLLGEEDCDHAEDGVEECLKRRMISEAHLDYIYTQHHKP